ncbi:glycoside hydrolase family 127 protein [Flavihumibacter sp. RY-1]|uniref:Glycoside hydrolase family 127 protein n=1 Tax=Flavihumibacter fluminis TaxID=2909236 RepID=A0ABS9BJ44_9BACT|nr:beta-L-arabinofuranosidase domain-containing protein [Flavihumibacter fluminis]MCF1715043.1 glycoside hydrolase family 127 protein [Flavihumibacter fluminis]
MTRLFLAAIVCLSSTTLHSQSLQKLQPVSFSEVTIEDGFWSPKLATVANVTIKACIDYTENKTGRIRNFERAAAHKPGAFEGIFYDDSDVYKALEAIAYSLRNHPDAAIEAKADEWIAKIAAAQLPDGYLNSYYTLTGLDKRWSDMDKHETYCAGHLIEAGIAYHNTTGKRLLLDVGVRFANYMDSIFRLANNAWVPGHQEIELALMKLYHHTGNNRYMELSRWFLDQRGRGHWKGAIKYDENSRQYYQNMEPVKEQKEITGHAVRAMYLYTGAADVAAVTNDAGYVQAMKTIWEDVVYRNMYLTGGIGAQARNEGFGVDYDLPNEDAYSETCASVGMVFWNQRMHMLSGDGKYVDVLERSLYNAALDGLSLSGDRFFYGNPLASTGTHNRSEWFGTACCPSNIARLVASLGNYIYATSADAIWVNLYVGSKTTLKMTGTRVGLQLETGYPWKGSTQLTVTPDRKKAFSLRLRMPGWMNQPVPGALYQYAETKTMAARIEVNGKPVEYTQEDGYAVINRIWAKGDKVTIDLPMKPRLVVSRPELKQNNNRMAIQYGPLVYCVEGKDNNNAAWNIVLPDKPSFTVSYRADLLGGINVINFSAPVTSIGADRKTVQTNLQTVTAIPYFSWNNRGASPMQVWLPVYVEEVKLNY